MRILNNDKLTFSQRRALIRLANQCERVDKTTPYLYWQILNKKRQSATNFYCYDSSRLTGFLSIFYFESNCAELSILVSPSYRRQKIMTQLLKNAHALIKECQWVHFSAPQSCNWFPAKLKTKIIHNDYQMLCKKNQIESIEDTIMLKKASQNDISTLCQIDRQCFNTHSSKMPDNFAKLIANPDYELYLAYANDVCVGKIHLHMPHATIYDVAILPDYQHQGFGTLLLKQSINRFIEKKSYAISLSVDTLNDHALLLYQRCGFVIHSQINTWQATTSDVTKLLG
jgi:ribosomal protein S18 acetylase RimI-like enzyme